MKDIVDESFAEATFLWGRWEGELASLTRSLDEVWSWTEDRLHGALDGVRVGGDAMLHLATEGLRSGEPHLVAASAAMLGSSTHPGAVDALVAAVAGADVNASQFIGRGLELVGAPVALRTVAALLERGTPEQAGLLCRLKAFRRVACGPELFAAAASPLAATRARAVRGALYTPSPDAEAWITAAITDEEEEVRVAGIETALCRQSRAGRDHLFARARALDAESARLLRLVALLGTPDEHEIVYSALRRPGLQRDAIWALGHVGTVRAIDSCVAGMRHEPLARACGEAYCWMTGAELARDNLAAEEPLPDVPAFEDEDLDADLVPTPEDLWPLPDVSAVETHWSGLRETFDTAARFIRGRPASEAALMETLESGPMLRRHDLAFELRVRTKLACDVETRAFATRQRQMMAAGRVALQAARGR